MSKARAQCQNLEHPAQVQEAWHLVYHLYKVSFCEEMSEETRMKSWYLQLLCRQVREDLSPTFRH